MTRTRLEKDLSKIICRRACARTIICPYCGTGPCDPEMSNTFLTEAEGVVDYLIETKLIQKGKLL